VTLTSILPGRVVINPLVAIIPKTSFKSPAKFIAANTSGPGKGLVSEFARIANPNFTVSHAAYALSNVPKDSRHDPKQGIAAASLVNGLFNVTFGAGAFTESAAFFATLVGNDKAPTQVQLTLIKRLLSNNEPEVVKQGIELAIALGGKELVQLIIDRIVNKSIIAILDARDELFSASNIDMLYFHDEYMMDGENPKVEYFLRRMNRLDPPSIFHKNLWIMNLKTTLLNGLFLHKSLLPYLNQHLKTVLITLQSLRVENNPSLFNIIKSYGTSGIFKNPLFKLIIFKDPLFKHVFEDIFQNGSEELIKETIRHCSDKKK
jgi:hypothetical protein